MEYLIAAIVLAVAGAGIAWVVLGKRRQSAPKKKDDGDGDIYPMW